MLFITARNRICLLSSVILLSVPLPVLAITIPTVPVGNPGNAADTEVMLDGTSGYGAVSYDYRIGTTEVTNAQYAAFLNAKAVSDPLGLYNTNMGSDSRAGITRSESNGSYTYAVKPGMGNKPVNYVNWYDSIRFANWLHNGRGSGDTESGAYTLLGETSTPSNGTSVTRNPGAIWFLPSEHEWYKAAYHQPASQGGDSDDYWLYPTASNSEPTAAIYDPSGEINNPGANVANFFSVGNGQNSTVTTVGGAGPLSNSYYGTADQGGNVWEWNEASLQDGSLRIIRGSSWLGNPLDLQSLVRGNSFPTTETSFQGFRVATVPEPSSIMLAAFGMFNLAAWGWRRHRANRAWS